MLDQGIGTNGEPWRILVFLAEYVWGVFFVSKEMRVFGWLEGGEGEEGGVKEVGLFSVAGKLVVLLQKSTVVPNDRLLKIIYDRFFGYLC